MENSEGRHSNGKYLPDDLIFDTMVALEEWKATAMPEELEARRQCIMNLVNSEEGKEIMKFAQLCETNPSLLNKQ